VPAGVGKRIPRTRGASGPRPTATTSRVRGARWTAQGTDARERALRSQARPRAGGEATAEPLKRRDGAPEGAARTLARLIAEMLRRPALHPPRVPAKAGIARGKLKPRAHVRRENEFCHPGRSAPRSGALLTRDPGPRRSGLDDPCSWIPALRRTKSGVGRDDNKGARRHAPHPLPARGEVNETWYAATAN
jgi:hypothetical protein